MKTLPLLVSALALSSTFASAGLPAHTSLSVDVAMKSIGSEEHIKDSKTGRAGGEPLGGGWTTKNTQKFIQTRGKESEGDLEITVHNLGRVAESATLEWHFLANPQQKGKATHIFNSGSQAISLAPGAETTIEAKSPALKSSVTKKQGANESMSKVHKEGEDFDGWIVRVMVGGQPALVKASSGVLESAGQSNEQLQALKK